MKLKVLIAALLLITQAFAISPYVDGYRAYIRNVKHIPGHSIKAPELLKKLHVITPEQLNALFVNNAKPLIAETAKFNPQAAKGLKNIIQRGKAKSLKVFLLGIVNGRIPPG